MLSNYFMVGAGGFLGAIARYTISGWCARIFGAYFPAGTLMVNFLGSFFLAFLITIMVERTLVASTWRLFWTIGFLGAFTTFSTFAWETMAFIKEGSAFLAICNVLGNIIFCLLAIKLGMILARI